MICFILYSNKFTQKACIVTCFISWTSYPVIHCDTYPTSFSTWSTLTSWQNTSSHLFKIEECELKVSRFISLLYPLQEECLHLLHQLFLRQLPHPSILSLLCDVIQDVTILCELGMLCCHIWPWYLHRYRSTVKSTSNDLWKKLIECQ